MEADVLWFLFSEMSSYGEETVIVILDLHKHTAQLNPKALLTLRRWERMQRTRQSSHR